MSEADSKDFVCKYSHEKYKMEFLLQNLKMSKKTLTLFQIWITICLKIKCCLTVYIETLVFYLVSDKYFSNQCLIAKNAFQNNDEK